MNAIEFENVSKKYNNFQGVNNLSFKVKYNSITGFIGQYGAGKTTSIKMIMYLLNKDSGHIKIFNKELNENNSLYIKKNIGYVSSDIDIFENLKLSDFWILIAKIYKINKNNINSMIEEMSCFLNLKKSLNCKLKTFSSGMKKKAFIGAALLHKPKLLILDEPFEGVDALSRTDIKKILKKLNDNGSTIFISSHDLTMVDNFCNEILIIDKGDIKENCTIRDLHNKYPNMDLEQIFSKIINYNEKSSISWI